ncbi:GerMN domain-containing protein [Acidaminococcus timonensis]|jgi:spore germination protein GerM|uniref:GerMN domain-containing protein n=1 Tax=Acidaminococcus timonensis TaxID=1871002 RepID=UPI0026F19487|nr:GerMN domain-containing protein [Acidaminococcus timonensis]MDD6569594.1 GerMN domain-containing protein [Acidaminococcus sp.]
MQKTLTRWTAVLLLGAGLLLGGCGATQTVNPDAGKSGQKVAETNKNASQKQGTQVTVYRAGKGGKLKAAAVTLSGSRDQLPLQLMKELVEKRPEGDTTFPKGLKVNKVTVKDKVATVDFSREFRTRRGDQDTLLMLYAIVDTLTELPEIQSVQFTSAGKKVTVLGGQDLESPLKRNKAYIAK